MRRPLGISILAIYGFIYSAALIGLTAWSLFGQRESTEDILRSWGVESVRLLAILTPLYLMSVILFTIFGAAVAYGLWGLKRWAWILTIAIVVLTLAETLVNLFRKVSQGPQYGLLLDAVIEAFVVWYLLRPHVTQAFARKPASSLTLDALP
jgi:hypothetical protein